MAALTAIATGAGLSAAALAATVGTLAAFLVALLAVGLLVVPRVIRAVVRLERAETTLVASIGICFVIALLAQAAGYSVALGAFLAGSLVAESGEAETIEHLVAPGARHVRRDLLRLGRHADRSGARRRSTGRRSSC